MSKTPIKFKNSPLGKIPEDWDAVPLSSLFQIQTGATPLRNKHQAYFVGGTIPWVKTMDLNEGWIIQTDERITEVALRECSVQLLPPKTVLVAMYGGWEQIGRTSILQDAATTNQAISSLVKISPFIEPEFALRALQYERHRWKGIAASTRKDPNITRDDVENFLIPLPPLSEQQGIAAILNTIDSTIAHTFTLIAKLKQMNAGLLHDLLTRGLDENGKSRDAIEHPEQFKDSLLGQIPKDWEVHPLGKFTHSSAFGPRFSSEEYDDDGNVATLRTTDMDEEGNLDLSTMPLAKLNLDAFRLHLLEPGDLLVSRSGTCGITAVFSGYELPVLPGAFLIRFRLNQGLLANFVQRYFNSTIGRKRVLDEAEGGVQKNLRGSTLLRLLLPIPTESEQKAILQCLDAHEARIRAEETYLGKLKEQKKGLMHDLLTGRVRVTDLKEIPA